MENYFYSKENIEKLTNHLCGSLNIKNTQESRRACRKFVETQMKQTFDKYADKRPKKMPIPEFLGKLNQKIITDCIKLYELKTGKKTNYSSSAIEVQRDRELYGNRDPIMNSRPKHTSGVNRDSELPGMLDTGGGSYASFSSLSGPGQFITASGEMGTNFQVNNNGENGGGGFNGNNGNGGGRDPFAEYDSIDKKGSVDDLERAMMERQNEYQARPMNMNNMNNFGGGGNFGGGMMYNPNPFGNNQRPPEINFALDGKDTRRTKEREEFIKQATGGGNDNNMESFMGFDGNMGGGGMNFDMMGMGLMGNQMGGNNNQMGGNQMMGNQMMGNQMMGNQMMGNQMMGNQMMGNQMMGNQMMGNQMMGNQMMGN